MIQNYQNPTGQGSDNRLVFFDLENLKLHFGNLTFDIVQDQYEDVYGSEGTYISYYRFSDLTIDGTELIQILKQEMQKGLFCICADGSGLFRIYSDKIILKSTDSYPYQTIYNKKL